MTSDAGLTLKAIAEYRCDFTSKFGLPRQSGLIDGLQGRILFLPGYRDAAALRGMEGYSHLWLIWGFSGNMDKGWSPTVRPPRLGGNVRMGVFATRSPFRPNPIGLSCVELEEIRTEGPEGPELIVAGGDLMNGTPIYDIKPYIPFTDSRSDARGGFADEKKDYKLKVEFPPELLAAVPERRRAALSGALENDPRPAYQDDPERMYGLEYAGLEVRFRVADGVLLVCGIDEREGGKHG